MFQQKKFLMEEFEAISAVTLTELFKGTINTIVWDRLLESIVEGLDRRFLVLLQITKYRFTLLTLLTISAIGALSFYH